MYPYFWKHPGSGNSNTFLMFIPILGEDVLIWRINIFRMGWWKTTKQFFLVNKSTTCKSTIFERNRELHQVEKTDFCEAFGKVFFNHPKRGRVATLFSDRRLDFQGKLRGMFCFLKSANICKYLITDPPGLAKFYCIHYILNGLFL